ncbi:MAG: 23S rRNA (adenine(2503)-C(2))-methyltransferase RlmN [Oscillospiraceae bacterium]|nr:23S rRNA (adenine(2503)-C(2))-methyltransferase RlmN [Oscillospiraceae bacterium]
MNHLKSMTMSEIGAVLKELGQPAFRAKQIFSWLHKGVRTYEEMTNLPKSLRDTLAEQYPINAPEVVRKQESQKDGTIKYLWRLSDGNCVETVLMRYHYGNTVCISTEVGCRMGCAFCASTLGGLVRPLEPFEMLDQVLFTQLDSGLPVSHIVLMGIGEPLDNLSNVLRFLELVNSPDGMNISMRHISLSTCGLVPKIDELAEEQLQISLAISLHGPNNAIRSRIMPVNKAYPIEELIPACRRYYEKTSRRIHFEYAMIRDLNDNPAQAKELLALLKGLPAHVNLIPLNHVEESPLKPSTKAAVAAFQKILEDGGVTATVRRTLGSDIDASCGQLRRKYNRESDTADQQRK